jgi:nitrate/TMAO reductase-like tetraheme cytochrome c subunit
VKCEFCHVPGNWKADTKPQMKATRAMETVMKEFPKYFELANASAFTCFTCHQGAARLKR